MSNELRAKVQSWVDSIDIIDGEDDPYCALTDGEELLHRVATAWLSEHPADDGEPADAEWLKSVGFDPHVRDDELALTLPDPREHLWTRLIVTFNQMPAIWAILSGSDFFPTQYKLATSLVVRYTTRGAVRELCRALGRPLEG